MQVERFSSQTQTDSPPQVVDALTYVDVERTEDGSIEEDYVVWIRRAIKHASPDGLPSEYVEKYLRKFVGDETEEEQEITMIRTRMAPGKGSLLEQEGREMRLGGFVMAGASGRLRDGSTA